MGRWFPGFRPATQEQTGRFRTAAEDLFRDCRYQDAIGNREENERNNRLNHRYNETARPLSRTQETWHRHRAADAEEREFRDKQRASDRQDRERRKETRTR